MMPELFGIDEYHAPKHQALKHFDKLVVLAVNQ